ncbi:helix-turn-helix domain-containing protein [Aurantivibrio infirmus]
MTLKPPVLLQAELPTRELRHLSFRQFSPHPSLKPWIQSYWSVSLKHKLKYRKSEKLYPDGCTSLSFAFTQPIEQRVSSKTLTNSCEGTFSATHTLSKMFFDDPCEFFGVRFYPGGAFKLLGLPVSELKEKIYNAKDLLLTGYSQLEVKLAHSKTIQERVKSMDSWLLDQANRLQPNIGATQILSQKLQQENTSLNKLISGLNSSRRTIERKFSLEVGMPPGQLKNLLRIRNSRQLIKFKFDASLTDIAHLCGYYDQAHFNRQFYTVVGETPGEYKTRQNQRLNRGELAPA